MSDGVGAIGGTIGVPVPMSTLDKGAVKAARRALVRVGGLSGRRQEDGLGHSIAKEAAELAKRKTVLGHANWAALGRLGGCGVDVREFAQRVLDVSLGDLGSQAAEWYNDDRRLSSLIGDAVLAKEVVNLWPMGYKRLSFLTGSDRTTLLQMAHLDLSLAHVGRAIGPGVAGALSAIILTSRCLTSVTLRQQAEIGMHGAAALALALEGSSTVSEIILDEQPLPVLALKGSDPKTELVLTDASHGPSSAVVIGRLVSTNACLTKLDLYDNKLRDEGARQLAWALESRACALTDLDLGSNSLGVEAAMALAEGLKRNATLRALNLYLNDIGDEGASVLWSAAQRHPAMAELNILYNGLSMHCKEALRNGADGRLVSLHPNALKQVTLHIARPQEADESRRVRVPSSSGINLLIDGNDKAVLTHDRIKEEVAAASAAVATGA